MKNYIALFCLGFTFLISCNDDLTTYTVGEDFLDNNTNLIVTDTVSILTSTIQLDSVSTTNPSRLLIGTLQNQDFGVLKSQPFFNLLTSNYDIDNDATYDSIAVILYYDRYYYGDTTKIQTLKVHEIIENFDPKNDDDDNYYNTTSLEYSDTALGELSYIPYPNQKDSIYIRLNDTFGSDLFDKLQSNTYNNDDDLYQAFKGLTIVPDGNSNVVLGFGKSTMVMRMYYTIADETNEDSDYYNDFSIQSSTRSYNQVTSNKAGTILSTLQSYTDILSTTNTNNLAYIQSGTSVNMRVEFPSIRNLNALEDNGTTLGASLKFYPTLKSYQENYIGADSLAVYIITKKNKIVQQLYDTGGNYVYAKLNTSTDEFDSKYYYTADLTYFVETVLSSSYDLEYSLLFQFPNNNNSVNKINIYDAEDPDYRMKLTLTYLRY
ncbi:DUF4270 family protein [Lutibacter sp.]|uniref:DUF4270 family protein n=1 Tax=Lutibacter sp. TaxID=1925666 RepID=UPI00356219A9